MSDLIRRIIHKLFGCPTFWKLRPSFQCPGCGKKYRCYWDGYDLAGIGIDYCAECAKHHNISKALVSTQGMIIPRLHIDEPSDPATEIICPVCGYYCLGHGGHGCIDKPTFVE